MPYATDSPARASLAAVGCLKGECTLKPAECGSGSVDGRSGVSRETAMKTSGMAGLGTYPVRYVYLYIRGDVNIRQAGSSDRDRGTTHTRQLRLSSERSGGRGGEQQKRQDCSCVPHNDIRIRIPASQPASQPGEPASQGSQPARQPRGASKRVCRVDGYARTV
jgi:hypothetical protein